MAKQLSTVMESLKSPEQSLTKLPTASPLPALCESEQSRDRLDELLGGCFALQKLYGKNTGNTSEIITLFQNILSNYPAKKVIMAFEKWLEISQEFPTPSDIIGLIRRNGKPPLRESDIIAINRKDGADRTPDDWAMLRAWEAERAGGWQDAPDPVAEESLRAENQRLRQKLASLQAEVSRLSRLQHPATVKPASVEEVDRIAKTVEHMRLTGCSQDEIEEFLKSMGDDYRHEGQNSKPVDFDRVKYGANASNSSANADYKAETDNSARGIAQ